MAAPTKQAPAPAATPDVPAPTTPIPPPTSIDQLKLKDRAQEGDSAAAQVLGMSYYFGIGVPQDYLQAFAWCLKAARQGNVDAQFNIAYMYLYGQGTDASPSSAVQWYLKAANTGRPNAEYSLAECYATGTGVAQDAAQAVAWYAKAAAQENTDAMVRIGDVYAHGLGTIPENKETALSWYLKAANLGAPQAEYMAGYGYLYGVGTAKNTDEGIAWLHKAAIQGHTDAKVALGRAYLDGTGVHADPEKAFTYFLSANGDGDACAQVALCYQKGLFVARDPIMAYAWALRAVSKSRKPELAKYADELKSFFGLSPAQIQAATAKEAEIGRMLSTDYLSADVGFSFTQDNHTVIPYKSACDHILIPVQTQDGSPAYLMLDTGCSEGLLTAEFAGRMGVKGKTYYPVRGVGPEQILATLSDETDFALPGMMIHGARWIIMPSFNLGSYLGQPVVGILGLDLLKKLVLHIDYVHQTVELIDPKTFTPPDSPDAALPVISFAGNIWTQAAAINDQVQAIGIFMIDTGDGGAVTLTKLMQEQNPGFRLHASRPSGAVGLGGEATSHGGWSSGLGLGPVVLPNPWMDLEDTKTGGTATICGGQIGNLIWNRFDFTLDLPDGTLYLKKNKTFGEPIRVPHGGMLVQAQGSDYSILTIADIYPGSASAKAGFQVGDVLLSIDELKDQPLTIERLSSAIREPGTWHVKIRRKGQLLSLTLKLEELPGAPASAPASPAAATAASAMAPLAK